MYKLIYIADKDYAPAADVEFTVEANQHLDITEMCMLFDRFLKASGYYPPLNATLEYVVEEEEVRHGRSYE